MLIEFLLCAVGLVVLSLAADHLVQGSSRLAARLRIKPVVVGIVVIGLGTSAPEFLVSASAAARGDTGIAVGNIVGSNILNLTLILGAAALIAGVQVQASVIAREARLAVAAVLVFAVSAWRGLSPLTGVVLLVLLVAALVTLIRWAVSGRSAALTVEVLEFTGPGFEPEFSDIDTESADDAAYQADSESDYGGDAATDGGRSVVVESVRALLGLGGVLLGAQLLVVNASSIAARFGVSPVVIGLTLVALGTSLPELVTTVQAQRRGESDLVVGNLFGSNLFNSLGGGAVVGLASGSVHPARVHGLPGGHGRDHGAGLGTAAARAAVDPERGTGAARRLRPHPAAAVVAVSGRTIKATGIDMKPQRSRRAHCNASPAQS